MQVNDTAMRLFSDTQDEDQKRIADLVVERMEREYSPTLEPKTATGAALTGSKSRFQDIFPLIRFRFKLGLKMF